MPGTKTGLFTVLARAPLFKEPAQKAGLCFLGVYHPLPDGGVKNVLRRPDKRSAIRHQRHAWAGKLKLEILCDNC